MKGKQRLYLKEEPERLRKWHLRGSDKLSRKHLMKKLRVVQHLHTGRGSVSAAPRAR